MMDHSNALQLKQKKQIANYVVRFFVFYFLFLNNLFSDFKYFIFLFFC